jgi:hypothetical protein
MGIIDRLKNPGIIELSLAGAIVGGIAGSLSDNSSTTRGALVGAATGVGLGLAKNRLSALNDLRVKVNENKGVEGGFFKKYKHQISSASDNMVDEEIHKDYQGFLDLAKKEGKTADELKEKARSRMRFISHSVVAGAGATAVASLGASYMATTQFTKPVNKN